MIISQPSRFITASILSLLLAVTAAAQADSTVVVQPVAKKVQRSFYGQASYYADKFEGRKTASGAIFNQRKMTAACNVLPLGTRIKVTNLRNGKSVIVTTNDRLHPKMRRIIDLTKTAAQQLGYIRSGLTRVKIEVL